MIRLIILLLGAAPLRRFWWAFSVLALVCLALGAAFIANLFDPFSYVVIDIIGVFFILEASFRLISLASVGFPNAAYPALKALGLFALGLLAIDSPWDDNIVATIFCGAALLADGLFHWAAAAVIRSARWRRDLAVGLVELILCALIWTPWPIPYRQTVPFCLGVALVGAAWRLVRLSAQLRRLTPAASVTELPLFADENWHASGLEPVRAARRDEGWRHDDALTVHVWTPRGAGEERPRAIIDRYIASVDDQGVISTGHAALSLSPDLYVSLAPAEEIDHSRQSFARILRAHRQNDVAGRFQPSLEEEAAQWRRPDHHIVFRRFNAAALRAFIALYRTESVYNLTRRNCSSTVALALDAAVEGALGREKPWRNMARLLVDPTFWLLALWRARAESMTWTPGLILDYTQTLHKLVEGEREGWRRRLSAALANFEARRRAQIAEGRATRSLVPSIVSLVATGAIFGLTYGLTAPLVSLSLTEQGYGESFVGANAAMHAVGVLAVAPLLPRLAWRFGPKLPITLALLAAAILMAIFPAAPTIWLWFPLRIALGAASETMFVMSETWLNHLSPESGRARILAIYTAALSLGFALGPIILTEVGVAGATPFLIGAAMALAALLSVAMPWVYTPSFERPNHGHLLNYVKAAPIACAAALVNAAVETAGMSFLPLYAMRLGWSETDSTQLLTVLLVGAIALQAPIGWLADRFDRRILLILLATLAAAGALAWPAALGSPMLAYALLFVWGGLFVGLYTVAMAMVGSRFSGGDLTSVYALLSIAWGVGAFVGPSAAGVAMDVAPHGLPIFAAALCALFTVLVLLRKRSI